MKLILSKDVPNLGEEGEIHEVARGYARNYLIPQGFGVPNTKQNLAILASRKSAIEKRRNEKREQALGIKEKIEAMNVVIEMTAGESGKLFGSVSNAMIMEELGKRGVQVERKKIEIPEHAIKSTGNYIVKVKLYGNEVANLKVQISAPAKKPDQPSAEKPEAPKSAAPEVPAANPAEQNAGVEGSSTEASAPSAE